MFIVHSMRHCLQSLLINKYYWIRLIVTNVILCSVLVRGESSRSSGISPLGSSQLEASLTASSSIGTNIAVTFQDGSNAVILSTKVRTNHDLLSIPTKNSNVKELSPNKLYCCMTGLACDVQHLYKCWANEIIIQQEYYYANHKLDQWIRTKMSEPLQYACWTSGRPFGVQALFLSMKNNDERCTLYSTDPSGQVRTWNGGATAIGKDASIIRKHLYEILSNRDSPVQSWQDACQIAIQSLLMDKTDDDDLLDDEKFDIQGTVIRSDDNNKPLFTIPQTYIRQCLEEYQTKQNENKNKN